jgi:hypothetical protein
MGAVAILFTASMLLAGCEVVPATEEPAAATEASTPALALGSPVSITAERDATAAIEVPTALPEPTLEATAGPTAGSVSYGGLRAVDWPRALVADPALEPDTELPPIPGFEHRPYVTVRGMDGVGGYAMTDGILYLDISGDEREEAVVALFSGGTAGNLGLLVYREGAAGPELAGVLPGYKVGAVADGGDLVVRAPLYAGWEANCCPSGMQETRYRLEGDELVAGAHMDQGIPEMRELTVQEFYRHLDAGALEKAYRFLSPRAQELFPYDGWAAGYASTESIEVTTTDRPERSVVAVDITATDRGPAGMTTSRFEGEWVLVWGSQARQWLLDRGTIREVE